MTAERIEDDGREGSRACDPQLGTPMVTWSVTAPFTRTRTRAPGRRAHGIGSKIRQRLPHAIGIEEAHRITSGLDIDAIANLRRELGTTCLARSARSALTSCIGSPPPLRGTR